MKPRAPSRDPRIVLAVAVPLLIGAGLGFRLAWGPGPAVGFRINRALAMAGAGRPDLALEGLQAVLDERPEDPDSWYRTARALRSLGRASEAAVFFRRAADLDPDSETVRFELARSLLEAGFPALADEAADRTLALDRDHAGACYVKAAVAGLAGEADAATEWVARALDSGPEQPDRFRRDPSFDPVRNDARFLDAVLSRRVPGLFRDGSGGDV